MIPQLRSDVRRILREREAVLTFVDVGSRNGVIELADVAEFVDAYGFEPNPEEYAKLLSGRTDAAIPIPAYRSLEYFQVALGSSSGKLPFYLTRGPGAAGLLQARPEVTETIRFAGSAQTVHEAHFGEPETIDVEVTTLDAFAESHAIAPPDYLKIDVEGFEYELLRGAAKTLRNTAVVRCEVAFTPMRDGQRLFSEVDLLMREAGFELLRYEMEQGHLVYRVRTEPIEQPLNARTPDPYARFLQADAVYINTSLDSEERALAQAVVLIERTYLDEALWILREKTSVRGQILDTLQTHGAGGRAYELQRRGYRLVDTLVLKGSKLARRLARM